MSGDIEGVRALVEDLGARLGRGEVIGQTPYAVKCWHATIALLADHSRLLERVNKLEEASRNTGNHLCGSRDEPAVGETAALAFAADVEAILKAWFPGQDRKTAVVCITNLFTRAANTQAPQAGEPKPVAWTHHDQLAMLERSPRQAAMMWGESHGQINRPLFAHPPKPYPDVVRLVEALRFIARHDNQGLTDGSHATRVCLDALVSEAQAALALSGFSALGEG